MNSKIKLLIMDHMTNIRQDFLNRMLHNLMADCIGNTQIHFNNIQVHKYKFSQRNLIAMILYNLYIIMQLCRILSNLNYRFNSFNLIHNILLGSLNNIYYLQGVNKRKDSIWCKLWIRQNILYSSNHKFHRFLLEN